jgi:drug/metabolite transporter (DMT)-like permease
VSGGVVAAVLCAALMHATWNAIVKSGSHLLFGTALIAAGSGLIAALALPLLPQPSSASWPFIAASSGIQVVYCAMLVETYRQGDISFAYPLMRGTAPLLVAVASLAIVHEQLHAVQWLAIGCICGGILGMCADQHRRGLSSGRTLPFALMTAVLIASYTLVDGIGVRRSGAPVAYVLWIFMLTGIGFVAYAIARHNLRDLLVYGRANRRAFYLGGLGSLGSYGIAVWAMTRAPVATVAALRETSILFATAIASFILKEKISRTRFAAVAAIASGAVLMRLA